VGAGAGVLFTPPPPHAASSAIETSVVPVPKRRAHPSNFVMQIPGVCPPLSTIMVQMI
jgi:hypothetical protein